MDKKKFRMNDLVISVSNEKGRVLQDQGKSGFIKVLIKNSFGIESEIYTNANAWILTKDN